MINKFTALTGEGSKMTLSVRIMDEIVSSFIDYPDNSSIALCVVVMGCGHNCPGCQNPLFQNPNYEQGTRIVTVESLVNELKTRCKREHTNKIVLSGGDPLFKTNIDFTKELLNQLDGYDVCIYTGYDIDYVKENNVTGFKFIKCGTFILSQQRKSDKDDDKIIFASPNQKLYNGDCNLLSKDGIYYFN